VRLAILHVVVVAPSLGALDLRWSLFVGALALPFFALVAWGQPAASIRDLLVVFLSALACGAAGATLRHAFYLPTVIGLLVLPYALGYLGEEFGRPESAAAFRHLSPWSLHPGAGLFLLWAWPLWALARRRA